MILLYLLILPLVFLSGVKLDENDSDFSNEEENLDENIPNLRRFQQHDLKLYLFTKKDMNNGKEIVFQDENSLKGSEFHCNRPTVIIIHGFLSNKKSSINTELTKGYLSSFDVNLFVCDWSVGSRVLNYFSAVRDIYDVGIFLARFLDFLHENNGLDYKTLTLVGHSLGAHIAGLAGKNVVRDKIGTIIGLDPAGPTFDLNRPSQRLAATDARYVESIHTDVLFGIRQAISQADFFVNNGKNQPGCIIYIDISCSHTRAVDILLDSLTSNKLKGRKCNNVNDILEENQCVGVTADLGGSPFIAKETEEGVYQLYTYSEPPFGQS